MMLRILRDKFIRLGRDDDGVALVTTLAVFMFMYLFCIGVYTIGTAVKTRVHLQNACDAAAYSAAVVQADTLSRVATLNRAMSWTYAQMTRRQMDLIVVKWLKHARYHYDKDKQSAISWYSSGTMCPKHSWWNVWEYNPLLGEHLQLAEAPIIRGQKRKSTDMMTLNDHFIPDENYLTGPVPNVLIDAVTSGFRLHSTGGSFYANSSSLIISDGNLESQIRADKDTISQINKAENRLIVNLPKRITTTVNEILAANMIGGRAYQYIIKQSENPLEAEYAETVGDRSDGYFRHLKNNDSDERRFLSFYNADFRYGRTIREEFKRGINKWFVYGDGKDKTEGNSDIQRAYLKGAKGPLYAKWNWCASYSTCIPPTPVSGWVHLLSVPKKSCGHNHTQDSCKNTQSFPDPNGGSPGFIECMTATCYGNNEERGEPVVWTELSHVGEQAKPLILRDNYFKRAGTITVGIAVKNQNPWYSIFKTTIKGIFSAFNIGKDNPWTPQYTVCIASAKAGYKYLGEDVGNDKRGYRISWEEVDWKNEGQSWNLCQSDWDAVLIPVRRAETFAQGKGGSTATWVGAVGKFLNGYLNGKAPSSQMLAGGNDDLSAYLDKRDYGEEYLWGVHNNHKHSYRGDVVYNFWNGSQLPLHRPPDGVNVRAKWRIGKPNNPIDWDGLQKVMFH